MSPVSPVHSGFWSLPCVLSWGRDTFAEGIEDVPPEPPGMRQILEFNRSLAAVR